MFQSKWGFQFLTILLAAALLAGCTGATPTLEPTVNVQPTLDNVATSAAATVIANLTQNAPTATTQPTATTAPTQTNTPELLPTNTTAPVLPTATNTIAWPTWTPGPTNTPQPTATPNTIACSVTSTVGFGDDFPPGADFDGNWTVKNTSTSAWPASSTDIRYLSGTKMHLGPDAYDLDADLAADASKTFIIDMAAPTTVGRYTETWGFMNGNTLLCALSVTIDVVD